MAPDRTSLIQEACGLIRAMAFRPSQASSDRHTYVPPQMQQAMSQHMQQSMPAHLKKYQSGGSYVPERVQREMTSYMQKTLPSHMKQYAGAYVEQSVVLPSLGAAGGHKPATSTAMPGQGPRPSFGPQAPNLTSPVPKQAMFQTDNQAPLVGARQPVTGAQPNLAQPQQPAAQPYLQAQPSALPPSQQPQPQVIQPTQPPTQPGQTAQPGQQFSPGQAWQSQPQQDQYAFIMDPGSAAPKKPLLPSNGSPLLKVVLGGVTLILLFVIFSVVRGLISGPSPFPTYASIAQEQEALIHLSSNALEQEGLTTANRQFAATAKVSLISSQKAMVSYLGKNKFKLDDKQLGFKISQKTDKRLETAAAATTYNSTFDEIMKTELTEYKSQLQQTYNKYELKNGRALLSKDYKQADLLLKQLDRANP